MFRKFIFLLLSLAIVFTTLLAPTLIGTHGINPTEAAPIPQNLSFQTAPVSCIQPASPEEKTICEQMERQILAATVRIELHTWAEFGGHKNPYTTESYATILDGKYLVTHNHFKYALTEQVVEFGEQLGYTGISLRTTGGNLLLEKAPLSAFRIVHEDPQALVLAFLNEIGNGLFESAGLPSALFADWASVPWQEGMEVAQVDWDGETAHVDWVLVETLNLADDVPQIQVGNFPRKGSSGSGVFWNGVHVGNTWAKNIEEDTTTDEIVRRYSIVALNSSALSEIEH